MATLKQNSIIRETNGGRGRLMLGYVLAASPFLAYMESQSAFQMEGLEYRYRPVGEAGTLQLRPEGGAFTVTQETPGPYTDAGLKIYGDAQAIDTLRMVDAEKGRSGTDEWLKKQLQKKGTRFGKELEKEFFQATGATRLTSVGALAAANSRTVAAGIDLTNAANDEAFLEMLELELAKVPGAKALMCHPKLAARLLTIGFRAKRIAGETREALGQRLKQYDGLDLVRLNTATSPIAADGTTSLHIVAPGENQFSIATNSGLYYMAWDHQDNKESNKEVWQMSLNTSLEEPESLLTLTGIKVQAAA